ncbi:hypothetical protein ACH4CE_32125 [Streptomyces gelaticus]|uniref:hypothetical protein n=1 Tax=Streptomyces gelaticus TaxID=285446 RepID=UPI00379FA43E
MARLCSAGQRPACGATFTAATTCPRPSVTGATGERSSQLRHDRVQQHIRDRHHHWEDHRISPRDPPPLQVIPGVPARDLVQTPISLP